MLRLSAGQPAWVDFRILPQRLCMNRAVNLTGSLHVHKFVPPRQVSRSRRPPLWHVPGRSTRQPTSARRRQRATTVPSRDWVAIAVTALPGLAALIALVFASLSVRATNVQLQIAEQGQVTDRYNAAITNLGAGSIDIRLGGIYALQRLMDDSPRDQSTIISVLCAFVREHGTFTSKSNPVAIDTQAALTVIGTRNPGNDESTTLVDLSNAQLKGARLINLNLSHAELIGVNFSNAILTGADFRGANLNRANLAGADIGDANFTRADLSHANLASASTLIRGGYQRPGSSVSFDHAQLAGANLDGGEFTAANFESADFFDADLVGADFTSADLVNAQLNYAHLAYTRFIAANFTHANFFYAELTHANFFHSNLSRADLVHANLSHADLVETVLRHANLSYANLYGALLVRANLFYANLTNANIVDANINHAIGLQGKQ